MNYKFKLPLGDWSPSGYIGRCEYFVISSNVSVDTLREMYFSTKLRLGGCGLEGRGAPCTFDGDNSITSQQILNLGLNPNKYEKYLKNYLIKL